MTARKRLLLSLAILATVYVIGVAGYLLIDRKTGLLEAVYMVGITLSTVGYREVVDPTTTAVKIWTLLIIVFGVSSAAMALGSVTGLIVEGEMGRLIGSRKVESRIKQLNGHVVVCGFGRMGQLLVERLVAQAVPLVVVEHDAARCREIERLDQLFVVGDATEEAVLRRAGLERAKSLVGALASDADNVFVTLTARQMNPNLYIVARAEQLSAEPKLRRAGANRVVSPQTIGAERVANLLTRPHVVDFVEMAVKGVELEMETIPVSAESPLAGKSLGELDLRRQAEVMVVAIRRSDGSTQFNPGADTVIRPEDTLISIGPAGAAQRLARMRIIPQSAMGS